MTLILSLTTPKYVLQVADRRVSMPDGRAVNDDTIKSVVLSNQMVFSFAGLAVIGQQTTDFWLTNELTALTVTSSTEEACEWITYRATEVCRNLPVDKVSKRLAFVGVGFTTHTRTSPARPVFVRISNFHDAKGEESSCASDNFTCETYVAMRDGYGFWHTPKWVNDDEIAKLRRKLSRMVPKAVGPWPYVRVFKELIRGVSRRLESSRRPNTYRVGKSLVVAVLPKPLPEGGPVLMKGPDGIYIGPVELTSEGDKMLEVNEIASRCQPMFLFIPEDSNKSEYCCPHFVFPGIGAVAGVQFFQRVLTEAERQALFDRHRPRP